MTDRHLIALIGMLCLSVAACGDDDNDGDAGSGGSAGTSGDSGAEAAAGGAAATAGDSGDEAATGGAEAGADGGDEGAADGGTYDDGATDGAPETRVTLSDGVVEGEVAGSTLRFLGIPFAAPPTGELRWRPPQPVEPWEGVRDATELPPVCPQPSSNIINVDETSEDCLSLNVWTPETTPDEPLPVMVWLHGGGNAAGGAVNRLAGSSAEPPKDGLAFCGQRFNDAAPRPVVVVTTNFRLGALGFLAHPGLTAEEGTSGNYGLMDQQAALRWVRDNIVAFGGDPENVTLFGQSAGALDTCLQIMAPDSAGLIHRAILQSAGPCFPKRWRPSLQEGEQGGEEFAAFVGCTGADDAEIVDCLRGLSAEELLERPERASLPGGMLYQEPFPWAFQPIIDGVVLPEPISDIVASSQHARIPVIVSTIGREGDFFHAAIMGAIPITDEDEYRQALGRRLGDAADAVAAQYPISDYDSPNDAIADVSGDSQFICPSRNLARALADQGDAVFESNFTHELGFTVSAAVGHGNTHGADLPLIWNHAAAMDGATEDDEAVSATMMDYWTRFAYTGDPNGDGAPEWQPFETDTEPELVLDNPVSTTEGRKSDKCDFWATIW